MITGFPFKYSSNILKTFLILITIARLNSKTTIATNITNLQLMIENSFSGDKIILANGVYSNTSINIACNNLTVTAETYGNVYLTGENRIKISGNFNTFAGFQFLNGSLPAGQAVIEVTGNYNTISQCNWSGYSAEKYIILKEKTMYNTISYCNMENKPASAPIGCLIQIIPVNAMPNYHRVTHCTFQNMQGNGGDFGNEPIRIGLGILSTFVSRTTVEYCYWNNTGRGDSESISIKSMENVIRYNVFDNNAGGMLVFRNGNRNIAYGNIFIRGSGGIRIKEANEILCFNNYFDGTSSIENAITFDYISPNHQNIKFIHNTFINSTIDLGELIVSPKKNTSINFINNIMSKKLAKDIFVSSSKAPINLLLSDTADFDGNIFDVIDSNVYKDSSLLKNYKNRNKEMKFIKRNDATYGLSSNSSAINSSFSNYSNLLEIIGIDNQIGLNEDINQNKRPDNFTERDIGCEEFFSNNISDSMKNFYLNRGPNYLQNISIRISDSSQDRISDNSQDFLKFSYSIYWIISFVIFLENFSRFFS